MRRLPGFALKKNIGVRGGSVLLLLVGICCCYLSPSAFSSSLAGLPLPTIHTSSPGLVGAPVDPNYGQTSEIGMFADFGYDTARDITRVCSVLSAIIMSVIALVRGRMAIRRIAADDASRLGKTVWVATRWGLLAVLVPLFVHLVSTFAINNFGGMCGGL